MIDFHKLRKDMITKQIVARGISDREVIRAIRDIPREEFVTADLREMAYNDCPLPLSMEQTISQPYMVALMTQLLSLKKTDTVLEVGTGSGYQTAILSKIAKKVISIERFKVLAKQATANLRKLNIENVEVICGDGSCGLSKYAPYDGIIIAAAAPKVPEELIQQLADGGRLVIPVGERYIQRLLRVVKKGNKITEDYYDSCIFVPLVGKQGW
jgi:protein-L-isoaspartate(D-aspartate) O-methyltransferase